MNGRIICFDPSLICNSMDDNRIGLCLIEIENSSLNAHKFESHCYLSMASDSKKIRQSYSSSELILWSVNNFCDSCLISRHILFATSVLAIARVIDIFANQFTDTLIRMRTIGAIDHNCLQSDPFGVIVPKQI